ncbi:alpha/beta hydrolase [Paraburkholderia sp. BR10879]|uniref:alpha/beta hydrolase n=1 Tax=Paraburkholderia sp. BR10879 TaxID=3236990 RepID=UPI00397AEA51
METSQNIAMAQAAEPAAQATLRTRDRVELPLYVWRASAPPRAAIALIHGLAEHAGRYAALATRLTAAGIDVYAIDLRGHGHAPGRRTRISHFDDYLNDAEALLAHASAQCAAQGTPLFLMGHSMGGASRVISAIWPTFPAMKIDAALLARVRDVVEANRADPLVHHGAIPARTGAQLLEAMKRIETGRAQLRLPVLIWHGTEDKLTEPEGSRAFGANVGSPDRTLTLYEGSYHETLNDLDRERVIGALIDWIDQHS